MCRIWLPGTTVVSSSSLFKSQRCLLVRSASSLLHAHVLAHGGHSHNIAHHILYFFQATLQNVLANIVLHLIFFFSLHRTCFYKTLVPPIPAVIVHKTLCDIKALNKWKQKRSMETGVQCKKWVFFLL